MPKKLKECQRLAAKLLSFGYTGRFVADQVGVSEETISRWRQHKHFRQYIEACQTDVIVSLEQEHFRTVRKAHYLIDQGLGDPDILPKDRIEIAIKYLRLSYAPIINIFTEAHLKPLLSEQKIESQENEEGHFHELLAYLDELAEAKRIGCEKDI